MPLTASPPEVRTRAPRAVALREAPRTTPEALEVADIACWRLPSGESLTQFALHSGLVAARLLAGEPAGSSHKRRREKQWTADS